MIDKNSTSISAYAKRCGVSRTAVQKAIKSGRIKKGYDEKKKKILIGEADKEYGHTIVIKKTNEKIKNSLSQEQLDDFSGVQVMEIQLDPKDTEPEAARKHQIIKAQLNLLKLKTESGELMNKEDAYKEMFAYGKEIRLNLQAVPDRIIDELITLNRNQAHKLLTENINQALTKLTNAN